MSGESWATLAQQMTLKIMELRRDLASSQAREHRLVEELRLVRRRHLGGDGDLHAVNCDARDNHGPCDCGLGALARPSDTSALRELMLELATLCIEDRAPMLGQIALKQVATEKVDAVLEGK